MLVQTPPLTTGMVTVGMCDVAEWEVRSWSRLKLLQLEVTSSTEQKLVYGKLASPSLHISLYPALLLPFLQRIECNDLTRRHFPIQFQKYLSIARQKLSGMNKWAIQSSETPCVDFLSIKRKSYDEIVGQRHAINVTPT